MVPVMIEATDVAPTSCICVLLTPCSAFIARREGACHSHVRFFRCSPVWPAFGVLGVASCSVYGGHDDQQQVVPCQVR